MTLEVRHLTVAFGAHHAVDDLTMTVDEGSIFGLVGPSGCGKSTLLRAIAGLVAPATGTISWQGADITALPTERRDVGFMFQDHALFTHRSVADNIAFGLRMQGMPVAQRRARVDELLELVGLDGFGDRSVEKLSGGEAQRVALARALAPRPRLLLLDEPLASLDRARRDELNDELARLLRKLGQTAIYVTHDQHEAFAIVDRIGVMRAGRLVRVGAPAEVWSDPRSRFVAGFVGHDTIIELDGSVVAVRADAVEIAATLTVGDGTVQADGIDVRGVVTASRFQGDRHLVVVEVDGAPWRVWHHESLPLGTDVGLRLRRDRLAVLDD